MRLELGFEVLAEGKLRKNIPDLEDRIGGGWVGGMGLSVFLALARCLITICCVYVCGIRVDGV